MKKYMLTILLFVLFMPFIVNAESCNSSSITIDSIELGNISGNAEELSDASVDGKKINLDLKLYDLGDSIEYVLSLKNHSNEDFYFDEESLKLNTDYIGYEFSYDDNSNIVKAGESKTIKLKVEYKNKVPTAQLVNDTFNDTNTMTLKLWNKGTINVPDTIKNSNTGDRVIRYIVILILCVGICLILLKSKKSIKYMVLIIGAIIIIPMSVYALCKCDIEVESKVQITPKEKINTSLYETISENAVMDNKKSEFVSSDSGIIFSNTSSNSNGKGIYIFSETSNDLYPIYYFRGNVDNNYVYFANYCWKIVRTTNTGGIKLIYSGTNQGTESQPICTYDGIANIGSAQFNGQSSTVISPQYSNYKINGIEFAGYMYGDIFRYGTNASSSNAYFGTGFTYNNGVYKLLNTKIGLDSTHHYTCNLSNSNGTCQEIRYYFYYTYYGQKKYYLYLLLSGGDSIDDAITKMQTNTNDSSVKIVNDNWYVNNLLGQEDKLEDTIWCNDRSFYNLGGLDSDGSINESILFSSYYRMLISFKPSLDCPNENDSFGVNVGNKKLRYPIGLLTSDEILLAGERPGFNTKSYLSDYYLSSSFPTMSPVAFGSIPVGSGYEFSTYYYSQNGNQSLIDTIVGRWTTVRPSISLKNNVTYASGDGTANNPYILE